jgi:PKHD-type hydroxylase
MGTTEGLKQSEVHDGDSNHRSSKVSWIKDEKISMLLCSEIAQINKIMKWNFGLVKSEPLQFSQYECDDHYNWHIDSHFNPYADGLIRKLSFSVILNTDYTGGEFECTVPNPKGVDTSWVYKNPEVGDIIVFPSHIWHKIHPVKSGIKKSLVGWILGRPYV